MAAAEIAATWLQRAEELVALEEGEGDPAELLVEELGLLRQLHSEDVNAEYLRELWKASGSWERLRVVEAQLRAVANDHAAAAHWHRNKEKSSDGSSGAPDLSWELLRPPYVPELATEVASAMIAALGGTDEIVSKDQGNCGVVTATNAAEKYVLDREEENLGAQLWLDPGGNLESVLPASQDGVKIMAPTATSAADRHCVEALCKVHCHPQLCKHEKSLCWHCWRREETTEQHPEEFKDLLSYARTVAETAAPLQRAAEIALRWPFIEQVAAAAVEVTQASSAKGVIVLGGAGVSAVRLAKECGARVWIWEPRQFLAAAARAVVGANALGNGVVEVVQGDLAAVEASVGQSWQEIGLIVAEGLEMDGLLGFGVLKQLHAIKALWARGCDTQPPNVLPKSLSISVRLADARVSQVSGFDFSAFARVSKAFAPFLSAVATNATSARPINLTEDEEAFHVALDAGWDMSDKVNRNDADIWYWPDSDLKRQTVQLKRLVDAGNAATASAVIVSFAGTLNTDSNSKWGESIFYVPPVPVPESGTALHCYRNSTKVWFDVGLDASTGESAEAKLEMPLHGPPFGHAYLQEWYLDMYRDIDRNDFYEEGLRRWVKKHRKSLGVDGPCGRVMDIGSGTGLLLFFALRAGAGQGVGVEVAPNLARMSEAIFGANVRSEQLPKDADFRVIRNDALRVHLPEEERPQCLVTEMMDGSGFGENMVRVILHAKTKLLAKGSESQVVPRKLKIKAALLNIRLPRIGGVDLSPFEAFWGPTRALGAEGEFANLDLDNPEAGDCDVVSDVVEIWCADFAKSPEEIAEDLRSRMVDFPLVNDQGEALTVNAVSWWFEAHLDDSEEDEEEPPVLTNVPVRLRKGNKGGGTHWHQAVAAVGPFECSAGGSLALKAHTDGKKLTWTSKDSIAMTDALSKTDALREAWLEAARKAEEQAQLTVWQRQRMAEDVSDAPRLASLQAAALHVGTQPGLFGVFGGASVASHILKEWFGAGCSAGF